MADVIIQDVAKEVNEWVANNKTVVEAGVYSDQIQLNQHCKTLTAIKGKYPQFHKILNRVVQGFEPIWQELGQIQFKHKMLQNFQQKVNFPFVPEDVLSTWLAELRVEGKTAQDHPISKHIMEELMAKVIDDLDELSQVGTYDALNASGQYGSSMNGIKTAIDNALVDANHKAFKIPLNAITPANILDEVKSFEKQLPKKTRKKIKTLFMSSDLAMEYADQYEQTYGTKVTYTEDGKMKTPLAKMDIVGLDYIPDNLIFATVPGNMVRLIDVFDKPAVTKIQELDYEVKVFMDWHLGYDFLINQLLYVAVFDGSQRGFNDATQNALYYDSENLVVV